MIGLIEEEMAYQSRSDNNSKKSNIRLSEHYVALGVADILKGKMFDIYSQIDFFSFAILVIPLAIHFLFLSPGRQITHSHFSSVQSHLLLLAYSLSNQVMYFMLLLSTYPSCV